MVKLKTKFRFKVGDVVVNQGATLKVVKTFIDPAGGPAYEMVSPHTVGEPWLVSESWLATSRKVRGKK